MKLKELVAKQQIIRFNDILRITKSNSYAKVLIHRAIKSGALIQIRKGVYSASNDIYVIASNIYYPSYLSFLSASYLYGFTEAIPVTVYVATSQKHKGLDVLEYIIKFKRIPHVYGYHKEKHEGGEIFLADQEKLMVDSFLYPECMGNFLEIENVFSKSAAPDLNRLKNYLARIGSNKAYRQIGYMVEKYKQVDISGWMKIDRNYHDLNPFLKGRKINKKWRLRI
jgi:predicted transcriptional regulator of viral defense system